MLSSHPYRWTFYSWGKQKQLGLISRGVFFSFSSSPTICHFTVFLIAPRPIYKSFMHVSSNRAKFGVPLQERFCYIATGLSNYNLQWARKLLTHTKILTNEIMIAKSLHTQIDYYFSQPTNCEIWNPLLIWFYPIIRLPRSMDLFKLVKSISSDFSRAMFDRVFIYELALYWKCISWTLLNLKQF